MSAAGWRMRCHCEEGVARRGNPSPRRGYFAPRRECLLPSAAKGTKNAAKTDGFGIPLRAMLSTKFQLLPHAIGLLLIVVGPKDRAPSSFRYRFAAAALCHGRRVRFYRAARHSVRVGTLL